MRIARVYAWYWAGLFFDKLLWMGCGEWAYNAYNRCMSNSADLDTEDRVWKTASPLPLTDKESQQ